MKIRWLDKPQKHDYAAAASYPSLTMDQNAADRTAWELRQAEMTKFAAKDIFRSSGLSLLGVSDSHVEKDRAAIYRTFAPNLLRADFATTSLYIEGPVAGAVIATGFEWTLKGKPTEAGTTAAQGNASSER